MSDQPLPSIEEALALEAAAIVRYESWARDRKRPCPPAWSLLDHHVRTSWRAITLQSMAEARQDLDRLQQRGRKPIKIVGSDGRGGIDATLHTMRPHWPVIQVDEKWALEKKVGYAEAGVRACLGDDFEDTMEWAYYTLAAHEGAGHKFQFGAQDDRVFAEFCKPEWQGSHVGEPREYAAWAVQRAVVEYTLGA